MYKRQLWYPIDRIFYCIKKEAIASPNLKSFYDQFIIVFSDYFKKCINGKYHNIYVAKLIQPHCPYCRSTNLKHMVQMLTGAFNSLRVQTMKQFKKQSREYNLLKSTWKLYLMKYDKLNKKTA